MISWSDPIIYPTILGAIFFLLSLSILAITKPKMVTKINNEKRKSLKWLQLFLISFIIGLLVSIGCTITCMDLPKKVITGPKMAFSASY